MQGAQPGHEGKGRELLPISAVEEVVVHWPTECDCGHVFAEGDLVVSVSRCVIRSRSCRAWR